MLCIETGENGSEAASDDANSVPPNLVRNQLRAWDPMEKRTSTSRFEGGAFSFGLVLKENVP
jgi:hypothetical protein